MTWLAFIAATTTAALIAATYHVRLRSLRELRTIPVRVDRRRR